MKLGCLAIPLLQRLGKRFFVNTAPTFLLETQLHGFHVANGGKMVPFAGWSLPSVYEDLSIVHSVLHTRKNISLFDVSHMLQIEVSGKDAEKFLESVMVADLRSLKRGKATLTVITNDQGGIVDDCIVTRVHDNHFYIVANASCSEKDLKFLKKKLDNFKYDNFKGILSDVSICNLQDKSLIALQGPDLNLIMNKILKDDLRKLYFMNSAVMNIGKIEGCRVTRCGYTGEDGIEISVPSSCVVELCEKILSNTSVKLGGLGARDILRIEAGFCLYGNEISENISPIEAGLGWCIGRRRRKEGGYSGSKYIRDHLMNGCSMERVGLISHGPVLRQNMKLFDEDFIGIVTSGCPSPTLDCNVAMAYIPKKYSYLNNLLTVKVRNKLIPAKVTNMPFIKYNYYK